MAAVAVAMHTAASAAVKENVPDAVSFAVIAIATAIQCVACSPAEDIRSFGASIVRAVTTMCDTTSETRLQPILGSTTTEEAAMAAGTAVSLNQMRPSFKLGIRALFTTSIAFFDIAIVHLPPTSVDAATVAFTIAVSKVIDALTGAPKQAVSALVDYYESFTEEVGDFKDDSAAFAREANETPSTPKAQS